MKGRIIQFGTSRFLQAHVDLFVHEARLTGQQVGPIAVVQASGSADRVGRIAAFGRSEGYPVIIRGNENGVKIDRRVDVLSVDRGLSAAHDWEELCALFAAEAEFIVSNTGDTGYEITAIDRGSAWLSGGPPKSFPAKLTALLYRRWRDCARPLTVLPCELVNRNGRVLENLVLGLVREAGAPTAFFEWMVREVSFADTLVDRIVSQPMEPIGAIAEPYGLWAIERRRGVFAPCEHPAIALTDDLAPYEWLKLFILNLGHTVLADLWLEQKRPSSETVRAILEDPVVDHSLRQVYETEVVPGFAAHGMEAAARDYIATTLERFTNPFLDHRIADIAQNHTAKVERRIGAFLAWNAEHGLQTGPILGGIARRRTAGEASA